MRILIGCECSGVIRNAFRKLGHDAWSCDIKPAYDRSKYHIVADVLSVLNDGWDAGIFHPPCTRIANSGVLRLYVGSKKSGGLDPQKIKDMQAGAELFAKLWKAPMEKVCVENPIPHCHARKALTKLGVPEYTQLIQPFWFGDPESKSTCLWLRGFKRLNPTHSQQHDFYIDHLPKPKRGKWNNQTDSGQNKLPPSAERAAIRATTYPGIALAMADQWGRL